MSNVIHILTRRPIDSVQPATPEPGECLPCFLHRVLLQLPCPDNLGWTEHYRALRARRAHALTTRLLREGASCDCEVLLDVWVPSPALWVHSTDGGLVEPAQLPTCLGVRPNSTRSCGHWTLARDIAL